MKLFSPWYCSIARKRPTSPHRCEVQIFVSVLGFEHSLTHKACASHVFVAAITDPHIYFSRCQCRETDLCIWVWFLFMSLRIFFKSTLSFWSGPVLISAICQNPVYGITNYFFLIIFLPHFPLSLCTSLILLLLQTFCQILRYLSSLVYSNSSDFTLYQNHWEV